MKVHDLKGKKKKTLSICRINTICGFRVLGKYLPQKRGTVGLIFFLPNKTTSDLLSSENTALLPCSLCFCHLLAHGDIMVSWMLRRPQLMVHGRTSSSPPPLIMTLFCPAASMCVCGIKVYKLSETPLMEKKIDICVSSETLFCTWLTCNSFSTETKMPYYILKC